MTTELPYVSTADPTTPAPPQETKILHHLAISTDDLSPGKSLNTFATEKKWNE